MAMLLPIPLKYLPERFKEQGIAFEYYMPMQCALCKTWYAIPPEDKTVYNYYCAAEDCCRQMDEESMRNEARGAALREIFAASGKELDYVPPSYRSLQFSSHQDADDGAPSDED